MGLFKRKPVEALAVASEPEIVERPTVTAEELERMVYETYREKLSLAEELAGKDAMIARLKEQVDKLGAADECAPAYHGAEWNRHPVWNGFRSPHDRTVQ